jgi:rhodanese-related sulfurtransferase
MGLADYFKPVETMMPDEVRAFVGQPKEYERGHIPGSRLIPLADIPDRLGELDKTKPTIAY